MLLNVEQRKQKWFTKAIIEINKLIKVKIVQ